MIARRLGRDVGEDERAERVLVRDHAREHELREPDAEERLDGVLLLALEQLEEEVDDLVPVGALGPEEGGFVHHEDVEDDLQNTNLEHLGSRLDLAEEQLEGVEGHASRNKTTETETDEQGTTTATVSVAGSDTVTAQVISLPFNLA